MKSHKFKKANNVYVVFAMKRSGHHAVMDWIRFSFNEPTVFFNDCNMDVCYNDFSFPIEIHDGDDNFGYSPYLTAYNYWVNDDFVRVPPAKAEPDLPDEVECLMWNYEDFDIAKFNRDLLNQTVDSVVEDYDNLKVVIVMRDPFNLLASEYKGSRHTKGLKHSLWKKYAKQALGSREYIDDVVCVDYTKWMTDMDYKKEVFEELEGGEFMEEFEKISPHGNGSSFNRDAVTVDEIRDKVTKRWKYMQDHELFELIFKDSELVDLSRKIYGDEFVDEKEEVLEDESSS